MRPQTYLSIIARIAMILHFAHPHETGTGICSTATTSPTANFTSISTSISTTQSPTNTSLIITPSTSATTSPPTPTSIPPPPPPQPLTPSCLISYPTTIHLQHSSYPNTTFPTTQSVLLLSRATLDISNQLQFTSLPATATNCTLELLLPSPTTMQLLGTTLLLNVYNISRPAGDVATWETWVGNKTAEGLFGVVDFGAEALEKARKEDGGRVNVGEVGCNETLTFQAGWRGTGVPWPEFVGWENVRPPAVPGQGWRVVHSC